MRREVKTKIYKALTIPVSLTIKKYIVKHLEKVATVSTINRNSARPSSVKEYTKARPKAPKRRHSLA
jgi:hypothetical protein